MSSKKTKKGDAIMQRRSLAMFLAAFAAVSVCFSAGCSSGSGTNLNSSVSDIVANVSSGDIYKEKANAATLSNNCKNYYAELVSGTLNAENNTYVKSDKLPSASATVAERKEAAGKCTIKGAMEYMGLINEAGEYTIKLDNLSADGAGTIFAKGDEVYIAAVENITDATTFGEIYKNMFEEN